VLAALALQSLLVNIAGAAESPALEPGDRVRLTYPAGPPASSRKNSISTPLTTTITGHLVSITDSTLRVKIEPSQPATVVPRSDQLIVERCTHFSSKGKAAIAGAIVGGMTGAVLGGIGAGGDPSYTSGSAAFVALACAAAVGLVGAGIGAVVAPGDEWERVDKWPTADPMPSRMGLAAQGAPTFRVPLVAIRF
jgi:hypothetical protein